MLIKRLRGQLVGNVLSLYVVQGLNYLLPLLLFPYLLRVLGPQTYGSIIFAQSIVGYALIVTDFGFNLTAARDISIARHDPVSIARIFWATTAARVILLLVCALVLFAIILAVPALRQVWVVPTICSVMVVSNVIFPQWYFQGLEKLRDLAVIQAVSKLPYAICVFVFIRSPADIWIAAFIMSAQQLFALITAVLLRKQIFPAIFYRPTLVDVRSALSSGWPMFLANASTTLYGNTNTFVLGLLSGETAVAVYNLALRLISALQGLATPITQSVFPRASMLFAESSDLGWAFIKRVAKLLLPAIGLASILLGLFAPQVVILMGGTSYVEAISVLRIMLVVPILVAMGTLLAHCVMVNMGLTRELVRIYAIVGFLNVLLVPLLVMKLAANGAAISLAFSEALIEVLLIWILWVRRHDANRLGTKSA